MFNGITKCKLYETYSDLTVNVALHQLQLIQNFDQIAICFIKSNCSTGQKFEPTAVENHSQVMKVQGDKIKHTYNPIRL